MLTEQHYKRTKFSETISVQFQSTMESGHKMNVCQIYGHN